MNAFGLFRNALIGSCGVGVAALLAGCSNGASSVAPTNMAAPTVLAVGKAATFTYSGQRSGDVAQACGPVTDDRSSCAGLMRVDTPSVPGDTTPQFIHGYFPSDLTTAYNLPSATRGFGQTIAVVNAFDDPVAGLDMERYRKTFRLPPCTRATGCYAKLDQLGLPLGFPRPNANWAFGASVEMDMASAICPNCHLLLVEANDNSNANLAATVDEAAYLGANVIITPYFGTNFSENAHYNHPGKIIVAPSGDFGYAGGALFPAGSQYVVSVGATILHSEEGGYYFNTVWPQTESGCAPEPKPAWQHDRLCPHRTVNDVSADGGDSPGIAVYDSYKQSGWLVAGGTGTAAGIIGAVYALAGNEGNLDYARGLYAFRRDLIDVVEGANGRCGATYLCHGEAGYDAPSGNGVPDGLKGF